MTPTGARNFQYVASSTETPHRESTNPRRPFALFRDAAAQKGQGKRRLDAHR